MNSLTSIQYAKAAGRSTPQVVPLCFTARVEAMKEHSALAHPVCARCSFNQLKNMPMYPCTKMYRTMMGIKYLA